MTDTPPITPDEFVTRERLAFAERMQSEQKQRHLFSELTSITVKDIPWRQRFRVMEVQAEKIRGLRTQMAQMNKGYQRKIARLEREIERLRATNADWAGSASYGNGSPSMTPERLVATLHDLMGERDAARAEVERLRAAHAESAWQPIETAPRDGTIILAVGGVYHGVAFAASFEPHHYVSEQWINIVKQSRLAEHCLTHWIPLPAPPDTAKATTNAEHAERCEQLSGTPK